MQVADAMDDQGDQAWVDEVAALAAETKWSDAAAADTVHCALLRLPDPLLHRVMSACLKHTGLADLLSTFPASFHTAATSAAVTDGGYGIWLSDAATILPHLPSASIPAPGLNVICLMCDEYDTMPAAAGGLLARALAAHPSVTRFAFLKTSALYNTALAPQWLHSFAACLRPGALPNLVQMDLRVAAHPGGYVALAACLRLLPALTSLHTVFELSKKQRSTAVPRDAYATLAGAPAVLPHLKKLLIEDEYIDEEGGHEDVEPPPTCLHSFLSLLRAPALHELSITWNPSDVPAATVLRAVTRARFPVLQELRIDTALGATEATSMLPGGRGCPAELPPLAELRIDGPCSTSMLAIAAAVCSTASASLTSIQLEPPLYWLYTYPVSCGARELQQVWEPFWQQIGRCTHLAALDVHGLFGVVTMPRERVSRVLAAALRPLTQLRSLSLFAVTPPKEPRGVGVELSGSIVGSALATLTRLRSLAISDSHCLVGFDSVQPLLDACTHLQHVSHLALFFPGVTVPQLAAAVPGMPALKSVSLTQDPSAAGAAGNALGVLRARFVGIRFVGHVRGESLLLSWT